MLGGGAIGEPRRPRVLIVEDEPAAVRTLRRVLESSEWQIVSVGSAAAALGVIEHSGDSFDVALVDLGLPDTSGLDVVRAIRMASESCVPIVMTGSATIANAVAAMRNGAHDFLVKPFGDVAVILATVDRALEHGRLRARNRWLERRLALTDRFEGLIGSSAPMRRLFELVDRVAASDATVLLQGESGTGKELVARAIHERSPRQAKPFLAVNCGAVAGNLLESELFGHTRGAFTGAVAARRGLFVEAEGGTVFLDEIGEVSNAMQVSLLRVLQEREIRAVGASEPRHVDVRVVAASNRDLELAVRDGRFRLDLYYRLNVVLVDVPPLRERKDDIPLLVSHFLRKHGQRHGASVERASREVLDLLSAHEWPGNVRELENAIERAVVLARGDEIGVGDLPPGLRSPSGTRRRVSSRPEPAASVDRPLAEARLAFERAYVRDLLAATSNNMTESARRAGMDRSNWKRFARRVLEPGTPLPADPSDGLFANDAGSAFDPRATGTHGSNGPGESE